MGAKLTIDELAVGAVMEATFWDNAVEDSPYPFRATHLDGRRAPKVVLSASTAIAPGVPCLVRVDKIAKPERADRGYIEVTYVRPAPFRIEGVYIDPVVGKKLQILLESGLNILLDGPQGCGKTTLARSIATALGMEFVFFNCGAVLEASDFFATLQVRASESGHPVTDFVKTELLEALEEATLEQAKAEPTKRYLLFLDELNRCSESARNALMPALDATRRVYHPIENRFAAIPDNVQFVAAVNRGSEFTGTFGIDAAQLDRFAPLQMDYPPPEEEVKILALRHPGLGKETLRQLVDIADAVRRSRDVPGGLSVRATDEACVYLAHPLMESEGRAAMPEVLKSSFCGRFAGRWNDADSDAGVVWGIVESALV